MQGGMGAGEARAERARCGLAALCSWCSCLWWWWWCVCVRAPLAFLTTGYAMMPLLLPLTLRPPPSLHTMLGM